MKLYVSAQWGTVYLIRCGEFCKIGRTSGKIEARMQALQAGNPNKLELICTLPDPDPCEVERILHTSYREKRISGEWFKLDARDIEAIQYESNAAHERQRTNTRRKRR